MIVIINLSLCSNRWLAQGSWSSLRKIRCFRPLPCPLARMYRCLGGLAVVVEVLAAAAAPPEQLLPPVSAVVPPRLRQHPSRRWMMNHSAKRRLVGCNPLLALGNGVRGSCFVLWTLNALSPSLQDLSPLHTPPVS